MFLLFFLYLWSSEQQVRNRNQISKDYCNLKDLFEESSEIKNDNNTSLINKITNIFNTKQNISIQERKQALSDMEQYHTTHTQLLHEACIVQNLQNIVSDIYVYFQWLQKERRKVVQKVEHNILPKPLTTAATITTTRTKFTKNKDSWIKPIEEIVTPTQQEMLYQESYEFMQSVIPQQELEIGNKLTQAHDTERIATQINQLINIFNTKVLEQDELISDIHTNIVDTLSHTDAGNDQIRRAIKKTSVSYKIYIAFFLIASASLLFLHWIQ